MEEKIESIGGVYGLLERERLIRLNESYLVAKDLKDEIKRIRKDAKKIFNIKAKAY